MCSIIFLLDVLKRGFGRARSFFLPGNCRSTDVNRRPWHLRILNDPGSLERDCGCSVNAAHVEAVHLDVNDDKLGFGSSCSTRKCVARAANVASSSIAAHMTARSHFIIIILDYLWYTVFILYYFERGSINIILLYYYYY